MKERLCLQERESCAESSFVSTVYSAPRTQPIFGALLHDEVSTIICTTDFEEFTRYAHSFFKIASL